jgi:CCR4-NOT complex subunit CAF16
MTSQANGTAIAPSIDVKNLNYAFPDGSSGLNEVFLNLPPGSRTLLIGGNTHHACNRIEENSR